MKISGYKLKKSNHAKDKILRLTGFQTCTRKRMVVFWFLNNKVTSRL